MKKIVVVGGGAGGLELVTRLSKSLGKRRLAEITLVDRYTTHVWKPLLHEVAAGMINRASDGVDYRIHAAQTGYQFQLGNMSDIHRHQRCITLDPWCDEEDCEILPRRTLNYDLLVVAIGSVTNDFGTPGVRDFCHCLDSLPQAEKFHRALLNQLLKINQCGSEKSSLHIAIVGAGATGTELAAQLYHLAKIARSYGMPDMSPHRLQVSVLEAGPRILPALPEKIAAAARRALRALDIDIVENTRVQRVERNGFITADGELIRADLMVWSAGVKAPDLLLDLDLFEVNSANQIVVTQTLQSTQDDSIFALGDCCGVKQQNGQWVPPRAQAAHQMANVVAANIPLLLQGKPLKAFHYTDYGSLVHLSKYSTVGSLMGKLTNHSMFIEGRLAKLVYLSLYNMHLIAVHGGVKGALILLLRKITYWLTPKLKLH